MPRSKRDKRISLTRALKKRGLELKQRLEDEIRRSVDKYDTVYHFTYENVNNHCLNEFRKTFWSDSRFYLSKNRVMRRGLGRSEATEAAPQLHRLAKHLSGKSGLLFTSKPLSVVTSWFSEHAQSCYAQPGERAGRTVFLPAGALPRIASAQEPYLRKLGLRTELKHGQVSLLQDALVCTEGEIVKVPSARILKVFGEKVGTFRMCLKRVWTKRDGTCEKIEDKMAQLRENNGGDQIIGGMTDLCENNAVQVDAKMEGHRASSGDDQRDGRMADLCENNAVQVDAKMEGHRASSGDDQRDGRMADLCENNAVQVGLDVKMEEHHENGYDEIDVIIEELRQNNNEEMEVKMAEIIKMIIK